MRLSKLENAASSILLSFSEGLAGAVEGLEDLLGLEILPVLSLSNLEEDCAGALDELLFLRLDV